MNPHDWLWIASLGVTVFNAWQNKSIQNAILTLKLDLVDRIAKCEGDIKALQARGDR
jgi:hypothetical protein